MGHLLWYITNRLNYQVARHPREALIQFSESAAAAHTKMNKLDPQIPQTGCPLM